jgi:hypothetical protein
MCIECILPQLVDLKLHDHERFFRIVGGRRCNNLNHRYVMPADEEELRVRRRILPCSRMTMDLSTMPRDMPFSASSSFTGWSDLFSEIKFTWDPWRKCCQRIAIRPGRGSVYWTWVPAEDFGEQIKPYIASVYFWLLIWVTQGN